MVAIHALAVQQQKQHGRYVRLALQKPLGVKK